MRSQPAPDSHMAELARRRLELLGAEIAGARPEQPLERTPERHAGAGGRPPLPPGRHARRSQGAFSRSAAWLQDRMPQAVAGSLRLGASHLAVLVVTIAAGLAVSAWWVLHSDDAGQLVPTVSSSATSSSPPDALVTPVTPAASPSMPAGVVVVDVTGKVRRPGIATLPAGSRVIDALRSAGGVRGGPESASLNLARVLVDGEQIVVGARPLAGAAAAATGEPSPQTGLVNLNTADLSTLETLPGVGPVTAQAILAWREENGGFRSVDELLDVSGIGEATLAVLAPLVTL